MARHDCYSGAERDFWRDARAPTTEDFAHLARAAFARLPEQFRLRCENILLLIEDFPSEDVIQEMGLETPFDILGLYQGVDVIRKGHDGLAPEPDAVFIYRRPILDHWAEGEETLGHLITHVLVHEIGHHFGLSDEDMEMIEAEAAAQELRAAH